MSKPRIKNALSGAIFIHRLGEIRDPGLENQGYHANGMTLLTSAIVLCSL